MMNEKKITVIGSYIVALVMDTDRLPNSGETLMARNYHSAHGGKGSNQTIQAARLGSKVRFVTKVGDDPAGEEFKLLCAAEKIDTSYVYTDSTRPTATGFIICSSSGYNMITIDIAALSNLTKEEIDKALECVSVGDIVLLQLEILFDIAYYAAKRAKEHGATVILNPAPAVDMRGYDLSVFDFLTPNETEARICVGLPVDNSAEHSEIAAMLVDMGCPNVIITVGDKGALYQDCNGYKSFSPFQLEKVVDSTGAGDAFNAALATALSENMAIDEGICFANAVAAVACTKNDTIPSYETRENVLAFMAKYQ